MKKFNTLFFAVAIIFLMIALSACVSKPSTINASDVCNVVGTVNDDNLFEGVDCLGRKVGAIMEKGIIEIQGVVYNCTNLGINGVCSAPKSAVEAAKLKYEQQFDQPADSTCKTTKENSSVVVTSESGSSAKITFMGTEMPYEPQNTSDELYLRNNEISLRVFYTSKEGKILGVWCNDYSSSFQYFIGDVNTFYHIEWIDENESKDIYIELLDQSINIFNQ